MSGHVGPLSALTCALLVASCASPTFLAPGRAPAAELADEGVEELRDHFTRTVVPPDLDIRWAELTLADPTWIDAAEEELARLANLPAAHGRARAAARLAALGHPASIGFEAWLFTDCQSCATLSRWRWTLTGPSPGQAARGPSHIASRVLQEEQQTLTVLDAARVVTLYKVQGELIFPGALGPGTLQLEGSPGPGFDPLRFVWELRRGSPGRPRS
ncbi:MAG: hypothetical protein RBU45_19170 [Myxococcota bacterium]|jgi:hypothetical protein|nr:hypothetical protein [Myxococcota bacterium]